MTQSAEVHSGSRLIVGEGRGRPPKPRRHLQPEPPGPAPAPGGPSNARLLQTVSLVVPGGADPGAAEPCAAVGANWGILLLPRPPRALGACRVTRRRGWGSGSARWLPFCTLSSVQAEGSRPGSADSAWAWLGGHCPSSAEGRPCLSCSRTAPARVAVCFSQPQLRDRLQQTHRKREPWVTRRLSSP